MGRQSWVSAWSLLLGQENLDCLQRAAAQKLCPLAIPVGNLLLFGCFIRSVTCNQPTKGAACFCRGIAQLPWTQWLIFSRLGEVIVYVQWCEGFFFFSIYSIRSYDFFLNSSSQHLCSDFEKRRGQIGNNPNEECLAQKGQEQLSKSVRMVFGSFKQLAFHEASERL